MYQNIHLSTALNDLTESSTNSAQHWKGRSPVLLMLRKCHTFSSKSFLNCPVPMTFDYKVSIFHTKQMVTKNSKNSVSEMIYSILFAKCIPVCEKDFLSEVIQKIGRQSFQNVGCEMRKSCKLFASRFWALVSIFVRVYLEMVCAALQTYGSQLRTHAHKT